MRPSSGFIVFFILIIVSLFSGTSLVHPVFASNQTTTPTLSPSPLPATAISETTATVDPASIGDTTGVIAIGMIVVIIILAGVFWGCLVLRQKPMKPGQSKD